MLFESVRTYVRITASIQSPKVRHALGRRWYIRMPKLHKIASYQMLNCTNLQKKRYADVNQRSGCRGAETMVISLCSCIFPDKSGCKPQQTQ